jgi:hypothetical protein
MPMDNQFDDMFYCKAIWYLKIAWLPHRCVLSHKLIWLCKGYSGTAMWTGPGSPVFEHKWIDRSQYLLAKLKGII